MIYHKKLLQGEVVAVVTYAKSTVTDLTLKKIKTFFNAGLLLTITAIKIATPTRDSSIDNKSITAAKACQLCYFVMLSMQSQHNTQVYPEVVGSILVFKMFRNSF